MSGEPRSVRMVDGLYRKLELVAAVLGVSVSDVVRSACEQHVEYLRNSSSFQHLLDEYLVQVRRAFGEEGGEDA